MYRRCKKDGFGFGSQRAGPLLALVRPPTLCFIQKSIQPNTHEDQETGHDDDEELSTVEGQGERCIIHIDGCSHQSREGVGQADKLPVLHEGVHS